MKDQFRKLLIEEMQDLYDAENQLVVTLPKIEKEMTSPNLKEAIHNHLRETKNQCTRLERAFTLLHVDPKRTPCKAMAGLLAEGDEAIKKHPKSALRDAALIGACQKVEHYEIAGYGTVIAHARLIGEDAVANLMQDTIDEEGAADKKLTKIAEGTLLKEGVNQKAVEVK